MPNGTGKLGLDLQVSAAQTGELQVAPLTPFVSAAGMKRGDSRAGGVTVRNQTGVPLSVRFRASANLRDADRSLRIRAAVGSHRLFEGSLGELRRPTAGGFVVGRGARRGVGVAVH